MKFDNQKVNDYLNKQIQQIKSTKSTFDKLILKQGIESYLLALIDVDYIDVHQYLEVISELKYL